jgi:nucleoside-diphosphate-sugar epimerase
VAFHWNKLETHPTAYGKYLICRKDGKIHWDSKPERPGEIYWLNSNHNLITELTGWKPTIGIEDGLYKTVKFWKEQLNKEMLWK